MAIGKASDFVIYDDEFYAGYTEVVAQNVEAFNQASAGAFMVETEQSEGDYQKEAFFKAVSSLVSRRDNTSVAAATDLALASDDEVRVKLSRKIGPVANTLDSIRKIASDMSEFSFIVGQQAAKATAQAYVNSGVMAAYAAISGQAALVNDQSATGTATHSMLAATLAKFGDRAESIVAWMMHSKVYYDLVGQSITDKITNVADVTINAGTAATLGRPVVITDDASLLNTVPIPDEYHTLGLVSGGISVKEQAPEMATEVVTGLENLVYRVQGEFDFLLGIKGYEWDVTNGGANPLDAALATATNWDQVATDDKDTAGVLLVTQ